VICEIARLLRDSCGGAFPVSARKKIDDTLMVPDDLSPIASPERNQVRDRLQRFDRRRHQEAQEFVVRRLNESTMETNISGAEFNICKLDVSLYVDLRGHTFKVIFATLYGCDSRAHALELHAGFGDCLDADVADAYQHSCDRREIGRHDSYPKRRGQTRVPEMRTHGINVAFGQDCAMDPWYSLGGADMLDVAHMGLHVGQLTSREAMRFCFEAVTSNAARVMNLDGYGLAVGCNADFVLLQASDPIEAVRLRARRLAVIRRGKVIAETAAEIGALFLDGRPAQLDPASYAPIAGE
jgi:Amidohydrolase family